MEGAHKPLGNESSNRVTIGAWGLSDLGKNFEMTKAKKHKNRVRELAAKLGLSYQAAHNLLPRKFYRSRLMVSARDGLVKSERVVNLSSFPKTGAFIRLADGSRYEVWHPILKARISPDEMVEDRDLPAVCVYEAPEGPASVVEVAKGVSAQPVPLDLHSEVCPLGVRRYVTRPYAAGDGIDVQIKDSFGLSMYGHHVYAGPSGLYLKRETLDVEYVPHRLNLPAATMAATMAP